MTQQQLIDEGYADGKKSFEFQWAKIELAFKWEFVQKVMESMDWVWCVDIGKKIYEVPSVETIKKSAKEYLFRVWEDGSSISSGGFVYGNEDGELWIAFTLESCHTSDL